MYKGQDRLKGKVVLITGGAVRIGRAIATVFAQNGALVVVHCNTSTAQAAELVDELNSYSDHCFWLRADLTDQSARERLIPEVLERAGRLDCLINNASVYRRSKLIDLDEAFFMPDWQINFMIPFQLMRQFSGSVHSGSVINLLDQRVSGVDPEAGAYGFAKKALRDATEAAAAAWAPRIRVNGVAPGLVLPPPGVAVEKMEPLLNEVPMRQASTVEEVADACLFLAGAATITGQVVYVDGGLHLGKPVPAESGGSDD